MDSVLRRDFSSLQQGIVCEEEQTEESFQSERIWSISSLTDSPTGASDLVRATDKVDVTEMIYGLFYTLLHVPLSNSCHCMNNKQRNLFRVKTFGSPRPAIKKRNPFHVETFHQTKSIIHPREQRTILSVKLYCTAPIQHCSVCLFPH